MRDPTGDNAVDLAALRLERALAALETRLADALSQANASTVGLFDQDRSRLAADLDAARGRERDLVEAGRAASNALGLAIVDIRAALEAEPERVNTDHEGAEALSDSAGEF
jgi:hypothetical protein